VTRSIRGALLLWYGAILVVVIGSFGGLLYRHRHQTIHERIDAELRSDARGVAGSVEWEEDELQFEFEQTEQIALRLDASGPEAPFFMIFDGKGRLLSASAGAPPKLEAPGLGARVREDRRELVVAGPRDSVVLVSRDTTAAREELRGFLSVVLVAGLGMLAVSLGGGWLLVRRVLRPIRSMTRCAERIDAVAPAERIDVGETATELGRLAATLNGAFDRLREALDRQTRFTADASHELRTPLSVVVTNAELGLRRERTPEEYREALETCLRAGNRMTGVVDGLLTLARSDGGEIEIAGEEVDLGALAREAVNDLASAAADGDVAMTVEAEAVTVRGDPDRLRDVIGNLVSNAIRYNRPGGTVTVRLAPDEDAAVLTVTDTGVGIPADALPHVFERFFRVDRARSREVGGNGLGLAITKWIVEAHGGTIAMASEAGTGTTATVRLPLAS